MSKIIHKLNLSKSLYIKGLQCEKALWLKKYNPKVLTPPGDKLKAVFETGNEVGALAHKLFPEGKEVPYKSKKIQLTQDYLNKGIKSIFEAAFEFDGILVLVDILHQKKDGSFEIYEVKSSTWNHKKSKDDIYNYIHDVSIQYYVLTQLGYNVSNTFITLLNTDYVRGQKIDIEELFSNIRVTDEVLKLNGHIPSNIDRLRRTLKDNIKEPNIDIGWHCKNPYECDAYEYCWKTQRNIPDYSVFDIFQFNKNSKSIELYRDGITAIEDIPEDFKLTDVQQLLVDTWKYKKNIINKDSIKEFVNSIRYPIYHFDFETLNPAIPRFEGMSSYEKYPFQFSLHIEYEDGTLKHKEFLAQPGYDPREDIVKSMIKNIPIGSCIMAYNSSFEMGVIKKLASLFPTYEDHLMNLHDNFVDLHNPFKNRDYLVPKMHGKSGLKTVLPIVAPKMEAAYGELDMVKHGGDAMNIYKKLENSKDSNEIKRYRSALKAYCELDTLAMVEVLSQLKKIF